MPGELGKRFRIHIESVRGRLDRITEEGAKEEVRPGGWRRKEALGHLIDSALNNHQRFVRAALDGSYQGPSYQQQAWVEAHGYRQFPWQALVHHWWEQNDLLAHVVERIPEHRLEAECRVGDHDPVSLSFLITDYLEHLDHHIAQIVGGSG